MNNENTQALWRVFIFITLILCTKQTLLIAQPEGSNGNSRNRIEITKTEVKFINPNNELLKSIALGESNSFYSSEKFNAFLDERKELKAQYSEGFSEYEHLLSTGGIYMSKYCNATKNSKGDYALVFCNERPVRSMDEMGAWNTIVEFSPAGEAFLYANDGNLIWKKLIPLGLNLISQGSTPLIIDGIGVTIIQLVGEPGENEQTLIVDKNGNNMLDFSQVKKHSLLFLCASENGKYIALQEEKITNNKTEYLIDIFITEEQKLVETNILGKVWDIREDGQAGIIFNNDEERKVKWIDLNQYLR